MSTRSASTVPITRDTRTNGSGVEERVDMVMTPESIGLSKHLKTIYDKHVEMSRMRLLNPNPIDIKDLVDDLLSVKNDSFAANGVPASNRVSTETGVVSIHQVIGILADDYDAPSIQRAMASWFSLTMVNDSSLEKSLPMLLDFKDANGATTWENEATADGFATVDNMAYIRLIACDGSRVQYGNTNEVPCGIIPTSLLQLSVSAGYDIARSNLSTLMIVEELVNKMVIQHPKLNRGSQEQMIFGYNIGDRTTKRIHSGLVNVVKNRSPYSCSALAHVMSVTPGEDIESSAALPAEGNPVSRSAVFDHIYSLAGASNSLAVVSQEIVVGTTTAPGVNDPGSVALAEIRAEVVERGGRDLVADMPGGTAEDIAVRHAVKTYRFCDDMYVCLPIAAEEILLADQTLSKMVMTTYTTRYSQWSNKSDPKRHGLRTNPVCPRKVASLLNRFDFLVSGYPVSAVRALTNSFNDAVLVAQSGGSLGSMSAQFNALPIMISNNDYPPSTARTNTSRNGGLGEQVRRPRDSGPRSLGLIPDEPSARSASSRSQTGSYRPPSSMAAARLPDALPTMRRVPNSVPRASAIQRFPPPPGAQTARASGPRSAGNLPDEPSVRRGASVGPAPLPGAASVRISPPSAGAPKVDIAAMFRRRPVYRDEDKYVDIAQPDV